MLLGTTFVAFDYHRVSQIYLQPHERSAWYAEDALVTAKRSVLFQGHAQFAELQITPLSRETAQQVLALAVQVVQWSPEPRVIEKLIESAVVLEMNDLALFHWRRYAQAYPKEFAQWRERNAKLSQLQQKL